MATSSQPTRPTPEHIFKVLNAFHQTAALKTAIELDLFTAIDEGKHTPEEIGGRVHASARGVRILCDYMTIHGFLEKDAGRYSLTPDGALFLSRNSPAYMGGVAAFLTSDENYALVGKLTEAVRRGGTAGDRGHNRAPNDEVWVNFARSMAPLMIPPALFIAQLVNASEGKPCRILDIAGGHGVYGITLAQQNPNAQVTIVDWPGVLEVAKENAAKFGVAARYTTRPGSAFEAELGNDYDLVLLTNILHHFDPGTCVQLLERVHAALKPGGKAITLEFVPNDDRVSPPVPAAFSLIMLYSTDAGDAYTLAEYERMFSEAGFTGTSAHPVPQTPEQVLISRKGR